MSATTNEPGFRWRRPWRSASAAWLVAGAALVAGVPLFLAMPPWCDVTLYQMAARNVLNGGVHYRDIFDTNLPGFVWLMAGLRVVFGDNIAALRAVDLVVIGSAVALLCGWVRRCGGTGYAVAWLVAAVALFYPFTSEFSHIQRDPWMLLPALLAARLRLWRIPTPPAPLPKGKGESDPLASLAAGVGVVERSDTSASPFPLGRGAGGVGSSALEGAIWGAAVWVKPHVVVPALAVWAVSAVLIARHESRRRVATDLAALILGGVLAGAPGVAWLVGSGAWPHFLDVFLNWNPAYLTDADPVGERFDTMFVCFRPWSVLHYAALPLATLALWEARVWSRTPAAPARVPRGSWWYSPAVDERTADARALLAALYLGWMAQAVLVQKPFDYVHVPLLLLAFAVVAGQRWCFGFAYLLWFVAVGALVNLAECAPATAPTVRAVDPASPWAKFEKHPLANRAVMELWPRAWIEGGSPELRDRLGQYTDIHCGTRWGELTAVAGYLRTVDPAPRARASSTAGTTAPTRCT